MPNGILLRAKSFSGYPPINSLAHGAKANLSLAAFYLQQCFRSSFGNRHCIRVGGRLAIYDVFSCCDNSQIVIIGHYQIRNDLDGLTCVFPSGRESEVVWVEDFPHRHEGKQVLIGRFHVPEAERHGGHVNVALRRADGISLADLVVNFRDTRKKHYLSVTTLIRDEARYLKEWIEYHRLLGVDHFYIYDNRSLRRTRIRNILKPYREQGVVTLIDWDYPYAHGPGKIWRFTQRGQMHHCLYKYGQQSAWMLFIDVDEYIYPVDPAQMSLLPLLKRYQDDARVAGLHFSMMWYGNSGFRKVPQGLVIENYTRRANEVASWKRDKCCIKPQKIDLLFIHGIKQCVGEANAVSLPAAEYRLNHYYATSAKRRKNCDDQFNEQVDAGMLRFVERVKRRMVR